MGAYYDKVLNLFREYLGPTSNRTLNRICLSKIAKRPYDLSKKDTVALITYLKAELNLIGVDETKIQQFIKQLKEI